MCKHVLIVDDSSAIRRCLRDVLSATGICETCGEAINGRDAIDKAMQSRPDLVVLDLSMPEMNGLEAARALKSLYPEIHLVMFTNFETANLKKLAQDAGVSALVSKSEPVQKLIESVQMLLRPAA